MKKKEKRETIKIIEIFNEREGKKRVRIKTRKGREFSPGVNGIIWLGKFYSKWSVSRLLCL